MIKVGILGATGYTGAQLVKLIAFHPKTQLVAVTSRSYKNKFMEDVFPSMRNVVDIRCEEINVDKLCAKIDCVFLALPHKISMKYAPVFVEKKIKVIDLSADFRFKNPLLYESVYEKHCAKELLKKSVYGLCEIYKNKICNADIVGNPGCYPTSFLLPMIPLIEQGILKTKGIIVDSKSGVSGAGRAVSLFTHFCEVNESFKPYKVGIHRHVPEMEEVLTIHAQEKIKITFVPHLLPLNRGMLTTIYTNVIKNITEKNIKTVLEKYYKGSDSFVRILPKENFPDIAHVRETNFCDIGFRLDKETGQLIIVSAIDNLLKGAAGQAVQNMNIMFGINEKTGLNRI